MQSTATQSQKQTKKVALGMSGGVDSSLCAHFLTEQGYDVTGIYLECWDTPGCRSKTDRKDALKVALSLNIPFQILDFKQTYKQKVIENFFDEYQKGRTPNPDVLCNKEIKFGLFYEWAINNKFDYVATGHYAAIAYIDHSLFFNDLNRKTNNSKISTIPSLFIPNDTHKDQTYFLHQLNEEQLLHTLFPLSSLTKDEVRKEAKKRDIHVSEKKDSVGICFIGDINVHQFLKERLGEKPGNVIDTQGNIIGKHKGIWFYTIGQRHGFEIFTKTVLRQHDGSSIVKHNIPPFYVIGKNAQRNQLIVGFGPETLQHSFEVEKNHWILKIFQKNIKNCEIHNVLVRIRHTGELLPCQIKIDTDSQEKKVVVLLEKPTKGIAEGQFAVFYRLITIDREKKHICLGGGVIKKPK